MALNPSYDIYGPDRAGLSTNPWAAIIDVPRGKEYLYSQMQPPGGYTAKNPATAFNSKTGHEVEISFVRGKKKLKRVRLKKDEKRKITKDESLTNPKMMFKYLKQYNKMKDLEWENKELARYDSGGDE